MSEMPAQAPPIESFVLRFVADTSSDSASPRARGWHGVVVHVQTNQEHSFSRLVDAVAFIARYVSIGDFVFRGGDDAEG
jgi:hypothetical protein